MKGDGRMDEEARAKNREKVAKYRAAKKAATAAAIKDGRYFDLMARLDTQISKTVINCLDELATATGTSKSILIERALIEYMIKYSRVYPANGNGGLMQPRKLKELERLPVDDAGRIILTVLPKGKPLDFPPVAE
jgi:hypothetical protein